MNTAFKQALKAKAHHLNPVVMIGAKGLTAAVIDEVEVTLLAHELIKVKINGAEKTTRLEIANQLAISLRASLVQVIGNIAILYRKRRNS